MFMLTVRGKNSCLDQCQIKSETDTGKAFLPYCYEIIMSVTGRVTAHDVAAFARDSAGIKLEALGPRDFESRRVGPSSHDVWFIDFFAPVGTS